MTMKSMKMTPAQAKESSPAAAEMPKQEYPYGLRITLDKETIKKLGIDLPEVGEELKITAVAKVTDCHASQSEGGQEYASCSLQITDMQVDGESDLGEIAGRLYKGKGA